MEQVRFEHVFIRNAYCSIPLVKRQNVCTFVKAHTQMNPYSSLYFDDKWLENLTASSDALNITLPEGLSFLREEFNRGNIPKIEKLSGTTIIPECYRQKHGLNPAHLLFGFSALYNLGLDYPVNILNRIDTIALLRCPPIANRTMMTTALWNTVSYNWSENTVLNRPLKAAVLVPKRMATIYCMDVVYSYRLWGLLLGSKIPNPFLQFSRSFVTLAQKSSSQRLAILDGDVRSVRNRCTGWQGGTSTLVIKIFERTSLGRDASRRIVNMKDVIATVQKFSTVRATSVTANASSTAIDHINLFNSFDVLISTPGSQLANMVLTTRNSVAIIEVAPVVRDQFWKTNGDVFGMVFTQSTGHGLHHCPPHRTHTLEQLKAKVAQCTSGTCNESFDVGKNEKMLWDWFFTDCDIWVNTSLLEMHLTSTIKSLCWKY